MEEAVFCPEDVNGAQFAERYQQVRNHTEALSAPLTPEDQCVQSMPDASPVKWHRAHTTWFFEQFILIPYAPGYQLFDLQFSYLFNSYYDTVGQRHPRPMRGLLTRPSCDRVREYREHVDSAVIRMMSSLPGAARPLLELGLHHEQQHQELLLTDMLHAFANSPLHPAMFPSMVEPVESSGPASFRFCDGGVVQIGHGGGDFCFDNETPAHQALLADFEISDRLVRNSDWLAFITDGGYRIPTLWMSDGWARAQAEAWTAPLYWREQDGAWWQMGLAGLVP
ncbi:MAG: DinB family protein, partial [Acetobacteraceae bacterium]|nr:DinB family protein [Acetobacteraceae bacterium]